MKITIEGMMCQHCVQHVIEALEDIDGLSNINVNLQKGIATADGNVNAEIIHAAIDEAGYDVIAIEP